MAGGKGREDMACPLPVLMGGGCPWVVLASPAWGCGCREARPHGGLCCCGGDL